LETHVLTDETAARFVKPRFWSNVSKAGSRFQLALAVAFARKAVESTYSDSKSSWSVRRRLDGLDRKQVIERPLAANRDALTW